MDVEPSEADLALEIAGGHADAESELCRRMAPRIHLYGLRHLRSSSAADDLVQQVLMTVLEALRAGRLRDTDKVAHFVMGTCRMTVLDQRRGAQRQMRLLAAFGAVLVPVAPSGPSIDGDRLTRCVQALNERERSVVVMTFYDEQTSREAATALGLSEANVRVIRHRAIKQLQTCIRLLSVEAGGERVLGEYTFHHTRTIPGPPGWEI
jgi:RNA polymerase sigma-70 factor (ECF subfamily)